MKHNSILITTEKNIITEAQAPTIISASRATDIPAFYSDWFFKRLNAGYVKWHNPFNRKDFYISFQNTKFIVFWSKNPAPLLPYIKQLKNKKIGYYIQFTLNNYDEDAIEPNIPKLKQRIDIYKKIVDELGPDRVVWRFDPMLLTERIGIDELISKISKIGDELYGYTNKLVYSYADIKTYKKVSRNLKFYNIKYIEWDSMSMLEFAKKLSELNKSNWKYKISTCSEDIDLDEYGISHNHCIDPDLITILSPDDIELQNYLHSAKRDTGQRKSCGCIISKDIGQYNTCPHLCRYCYANSSENSIIANYKKHINNKITDKII